jgi:hypothetical protein
MNTNEHASRLLVDSYLSLCNGHHHQVPKGQSLASPSAVNLFLSIYSPFGPLVNFRFVFRR